MTKITDAIDKGVEGFREAQLHLQGKCPDADCRFLKQGIDSEQDYLRTFAESILQAVIEEVPEFKPDEEHESYVSGLYKDGFNACRTQILAPLLEALGEKKV